ncbi:MAG TPA: hypothetical protein VFQ38_10270 [Longimicrobiales bacterium]|nr:hypothetical protein [Longimicrobiales bacterium]
MQPTRTIRRLALVATLSATCACGSSSGGTQPGPTGSLIVAVVPSAVTVRRGARSVVVAAATRGGRFTGPVTFTLVGLPPGVTAQVPAGTTTGTVTSADIVLAATPSAAVGTFNVAIRVRGSGVPDATALLALTVAG